MSILGSRVVSAQLFGMELKFLAGIIRAAAFCGFFVFSAAVLYLSSRESVPAVWRSRARTLFVVAVFVGMIVPTVLVPVPPFSGWGFFSDPAPATDTQYQTFVVDDTGAELRYASDAAPPGLGSYPSRMVMEFSATERERTAAFLLQRATIHRTKIADGLSLYEWIQYRSSGGLPARTYHAWSPAELEEYAAFAGVRIYEVELTSIENGSSVAIDRVERSLIYEYHENGTETLSPEE